MRHFRLRFLLLLWTTLRRQTFALANGATTPEGRYLAIEAALAALKDHHSTFRTPNETAVYGSTGALTSNEKPHGQFLAHDIGYLELPTYNRVPPVAASKDYILLAQDAIRLADQAGACGWIVDLRNDTGGDSWPMLAAVGPLGVKE
jgi:carboxyl-terminal processing protease